MSHLHSIVVYGHDATLQETRGWVLQRAGYRVVMATSLSEVRQILSEESIDLLIVCHSVSLRDREEALAIARSVRPRMPRLLIGTSAAAESRGESDPVVSSFDGPRGLIAGVQQTLGSTNFQSIEA